MIPTEKPLDNPINWSFRVGRLWDVEIRVHVAFIIAAVILLWMEMPRAGEVDPRGFTSQLVDAFGTYAILFGVVLVHEFGHCWGARRTGGEATEILLWPLGGLAYVQPVHSAKAHAITALSGPMVNVVVCAVCAGALTVMTGSLGAVPWNPFHPMRPINPLLFPTTTEAWIIRTFGLSYFLLLINLLPIFPFDGGRVLQAWLWPVKGYRAATEIATGVGMIGAIVVGLVGLFAGEGGLVLMIALFGYLTCWQTRRQLREQGDFELGESGFDFTRGHPYSEEEERGGRRVGFFARRRARRAAARADKERCRQAEHARAVEEILRKISTGGMNSLTADERRILERETHRRLRAAAETGEAVR